MVQPEPATAVILYTSTARPLTEYVAKPLMSVVTVGEITGVPFPLSSVNTTGIPERSPGTIEVTVALKIAGEPNATGALLALASIVIPLTVNVPVIKLKL